MAKIKDILWQKFGLLTVVSYAYTKKVAYWNCICECGNTITVRSISLRVGNTKSCGCVGKEHISRLGASSKTHGEGNKTTEHRTWVAIKSNRKSDFELIK